MSLRPVCVSLWTLRVLSFVSWWLFAFWGGVSRFSGWGFLVPSLCNTCLTSKMSQAGVVPEGGNNGGPLSGSLQTCLSRPRPPCQAWALWHFDWAHWVGHGNKVLLRCRCWFGLCLPSPWLSPSEGTDRGTFIPVMTLSALAGTLTFLPVFVWR